MRALGIFAALLAIAPVANAQSAPEGPVCRAERRGTDLITRIEYPDGYVVEGPWHVTVQRRTANAASIVTAVLDRIIEKRPFTRHSLVTPLPDAVTMTFRGKSLSGAIQEAARIWCNTVLRARPQQPGLHDHMAASNRIM